MQNYIDDEVGLFTTQQPISEQFDLFIHSNAEDNHVRT